MSELKPCPFCGGDSVTLQSLGDHTRAGCVDCGAEVTRPMGLYRNAMIEWNTRPIEDALNKRIAELETKIRHNALWQASEDSEERAHLEKLVPDLKKRIAELEALVDELVNIGDNLFDSLNPIAWKHEWLDKWWKLSNCRRGEREE